MEKKNNIFIETISGGKTLLKDIKFERQIRINSRLNNGHGEVDSFTKWLRSWPDSDVIEIGTQSLNQILKFKFTHNVLNASTYLAHVVRVTRMSLEFCPEIANKSIAPALMHNILETTNLTEIDLLKKFDSFTVSTVKTLTMDRKKQHLFSYLNDYYSTIMESHLSVGVIKLADKIDNIFTLCLNPDKKKRENYLKQIEDFVIPLAELKVPQVSDYIVKLVDNAYKTGHIPTSDAE